MIHGGLDLSLVEFAEKPSDVESDLWPKVHAQFCCLLPRATDLIAWPNWWNGPRFAPARQQNLENQWLPECVSICKNLEDSGITSFRQGMNSGLKIYKRANLSGPARIDLTADLSCNLACRTCGPNRSTFWQKHLKDNNLTDKPVTIQRSSERTIEVLRNLDLSNLRMLVFCGGETLLGKTNWEIAEWLADNIPNAKKQLTLCFQTNGTMPIDPGYFKLIERFFLVKLHISIDGVEEQFEYLRWPASWAQVTNNILSMKETLPSNVMFLVEETLSIFNFATTNRVSQWVNENFTANRFGDIVNHSKHLVSGTHGFSELSAEYAAALKKDPNFKNLVPANFEENPEAIKLMINRIKKFDQIRGQDFASTFPEVFEFYQKFW